MARNAHPLGFGRLSCEQLASFDHLLVDLSGRSFVGPIDLALRESGQARRVAITVPTFPNLFDLLQTDDHLAFVPERLVKAQATGLKDFETDVGPPDLEIIAPGTRALKETRGTYGSEIS